VDESCLLWMEMQVFAGSKQYPTNKQ